MRGSSPLARGLRLGVVTALLGIRIIPARAGFTSGGGQRSARAWDHPRSRGVYRVRALRERLRRGSSPLARGLPRTSTAFAGVRRIIPARAGFTLRGVL